MKLLVIFLVCLGAELGSTATDTGQIALKFGEDGNSYISYNPDMRAFANGYTLCSWIRKLKSGDSSIWFTYPSGANTIYSYDSGNYVFFGDFINLTAPDKFSSEITPGEWHHSCASWSSQGNRARAYWNGVLAGEKQTPSGNTVPAGGTLILANWKPGGSNPFGGEMLGLNMYNRELTAEEIGKIAAYCPGDEELFDDSRFLKWEDILKQQRTGDVKEVKIAQYSDACKPRKATEECEKTKDTLTLTTKQLNAATDELQVTKQKLTSTTQQRNTATEELQKVKGQLKQCGLNSATQQQDVVTQQLDDMKQCLENKIKRGKSVRNKRAKRVFDQFKTCLTSEERDEEV